MHIFLECHLLDISGTLVTNMQNFSRNVTERWREISRRSKIFMLSERNLELPENRDRPCATFFIPGAAGPDFK